ncbi:MAG TPA: hypothetical protein PK989_10070 [Anaerolineales bacterium]|nr:hypothetical protein [Anaerolineales bacterium]
MNRLSSLSRRLFLAASVFAFVLQACTLTLFENPFGSISTTATPGAVIATNTPYPVAQTTFVVTLPEALQPGETLVLAVIDEVTGANTNVTQYPMAPRDSLTYAGTLAVPYNSVVKYRYMRIGPGQVMEDTTLGTAIRYRMYFAAGPGEVRDIIGGWSGKTLQVASGTILGQVFNADTNTPVPNILVTAGGVQHLTDSFGRFELGGLAVGTHQLVAYSLDGFYVPFEQGAVVSGGSTTIVDLRIKPTRLVNVTFVVSVPQNTVPGVPVRIAGNLLQLGNAFADLQGGINTVPDRMPILSLQADGRYAMTMGLPVGTYIQYKYTLGDGFWNAEHKPGGEWLLREFIVPGQDTTIQDSVASWQATQESAPILYEVTAPSVTPPGDIVYIQFNAFGWTEPVPMWPLGNNRWAYKLYSPLNFFGNVVYRYCRNGQCGSADDNQTVGPAPTGRQSTTSILDQDIQDGVNSWKWYENPETYPLVGNAITPRSAGFVAGVEYQDAYRPNYSYYAPQAYANTKALGANLAIFSPSWTFSSISPLRFGTVPGQDPLWIDSAIMISQARTLGLNAAIFPTPHFPPAPDTATPASAAFWKNAPRDAAWWQNFFTRYRAFLVNYADLANQTGAQSIILGGDWITPALPGGTLSDGTSSNVPADAEAQWRAIIQDVRSRFKGQVFWAMPYSKAGFQSPVNFIRDVDAIYLLWSVPVATSQTATKTDYANEVGRLLDTEVQPMTNLLGKPLIIAAAYPSASGAASGCISNGAGGCVDFPALSMPNADIPAVGLNLQTQADIYEAMLIAINSRPWVAGFVSRGYFMPVALQDKSTSIHSKPAADVLWYWFPRMLGTIK